MKNYKRLDHNMKKTFVLITMLLATAAGFAQSYYTGDGGKGITLAVLEPTGKELADSDRWILPLVQGAFNSAFNRYSAINIVDRQNLDKILAEQAQSASGNYSDDDYISIGKLANARNILVGTITKTPNGSFMLEFSVSDAGAGKRLASYGPKPCAPAALEDISAMNIAAADLLEQLGVQLTDKGKRELTAAMDTQQVQAETALSKGIAAQKNGTVVEAFAYYLQAVNYDPASAEIVSRLDIMNEDITSSSMGEDIRNSIAWRKAWVGRLSECDQFVAGYVKKTPLTTTLIYSADFKQGDIDWDKETIPISIDVCLTPDEGWPLPVTGVVNAVYAGFAGTGQAATWKLDWPLKNAAGRASEVMPSTEVKYNLVLDLLNDKGAVLGRQGVTFSAGWNIEFREGKSVGVKTQTPQTITYPAVNANNISETLVIRVASINGRIVSAAAGNSVAVRTMTGKDYKTAIAGADTYPGGWAVMPEGEFFIQTVHAPEGSLNGVWDIAGDYLSYRPGLRIEIWGGPVTKNYNTDNAWDLFYHFVPLGDGWYNIMTHGNHPVDVQGGRDDNGIPLQLWDANDSPAQKFRFKKRSDGTYIIYTFSGRTIHTARANISTDFHTFEELPDNHRDVKNQLWRLVKP